MAEICMWKLQIVDDEGQRSEVALDSDEITVGRNEWNTIRLPEQNVSRRHAKLLRTDGHMFIEDVGSSFGTKVNGHRLHGRRELAPGDEVVIGDYHLLIWHEREEAEVSKPDVEPDGAYQLGRARLIPQEFRGRLVVTLGRLAGLEVSLDRTPMTVGRGEDCTFRLDDGKVSQHEATITYETGTFFINSASPKSKIRVQGDAVSTAVLRTGDTVEIGGVTLQFLGPGAMSSLDVSQSEIPVGSFEAETSRRTAGALKKGIAFAVIAGGIGITWAWFNYYNAPLDVDTAPQSVAIVPSSGGPRADRDTGADTAVAVASPPAAPAPSPSSAPGAAGAANTGEAAANVAATGPNTAAQPGSQPAASASATPPTGPTTDTPPAPAPPAAQGVNSDGGADAAQHARAVAEAKSAFSQSRWDDAVHWYDKAIELQPNDAEARARRDLAAAERSRLTLIEEAADAMKQGNPAVAWHKLQSLSIPSTSTYAERAASLRAEAKVAYTERLAIEGEKALAKGDAPRALSLADQALGVDSAHARSKKLKQKARAAVDSSRGSAVDSGAPPPDAEPPSAGATETPQEKAKQFYLEGRTEARKGNDQGALKKFEDAIRTAPYAPAHKQLGILYAKRGEAERAMDHYKKYLKMSPNADDADAVRLAIERLGGQ